MLTAQTCFIQMLATQTAMLVTHAYYIDMLKIHACYTDMLVTHACYSDSQPRLLCAHFEKKVQLRNQVVYRRGDEWHRGQGSALISL